MTFRTALTAMAGLAMLLSITASAGAQPLRPTLPDGSSDGPPDSLLLHYDFSVGESLTYRVETTDSVIIYDAPYRRLRAERVEMINYRCRKVLPDGFIMTATLQEYVARESKDGLPMVTRTEHPWVGRELTFKMNRQGKREKFYSSTDTAGVGPGGPLQPMLLTYLGDSATYIGSSQTLDVQHWIFENVVPPTLWFGTIFRVIPRRLDTLGERTVEVSISQTGQVRYEPAGSARTHAIVNGVDMMYFSPSRGYPIAGHVDLRANLKIGLPDGRNVDGREVITTKYRVVEPRSSSK